MNRSRRGHETVSQPGKKSVVIKKRAGNMASLIYDRLRADILDGVLPPGTPLSQLAVASTHGTSRGPVREALRRLQQDELVIARENHRFNVAPYDVSDLEELLCLQLANVTLAIRVSVPHLTDPELRQMEACVGLLETLFDADKQRFKVAFRDFCLTLVKHAGRRIESLVAGVVDNLERYRQTSYDKAPIVYTGGPEFRRITKAAAAGDGVLASELYAKFISRMSMLILAGVAPHYDASRLREYVLALDAYDAT